MFDIFSGIIKIITITITSVFVFLGIGTLDTTLVYEKKLPSASEAPFIEEIKTSPQEHETLPQQKETPEEIAALPEIAPTKEVVQEIIPPLVATIEKETLSGATLNESVRQSVVNIFCLSAHGGLFNPISASGTIIDERGLIITNAHVAQYFLLDTYHGSPFIDCVIRTGSPAQVSYTAELLYISSQWITDHAENIVKTGEGVTGENDFALLFINGTANTSRTLPKTFPALNIFPIEKQMQKNDPVLVAGYPAGFLGGITINRDLWISSSITTIKELFTFHEAPGPLDLISVGGIISAQEGASGGAVVSMYDAQLLGIIAIRTEGETTGERDLRALTLQHINRSFQKETGSSLKTFLSGSLEEKLEDYRETFLEHKQKLITILER